MVGLASFALAGAAGGLGDDIVKRAEQAREERLAALKRSWDVEDREARFANERDMYGLRRGDEVEDRDLRNSREDASTERGAGALRRTYGDGTDLWGLVAETEGAGNPDTLFGFSEKPSGKFAGIKVSEMTLDQLAEFSDPDGEYGQWVKSELARTGQKPRVATPMGEFQIVGTTMREVAAELGLDGNTVFSADVQRQMADHLAAKALAGATTPAGKRRALRGVWEGFKHVDDARLDAAIATYERGGGLDEDTALALADPNTTSTVSDALATGNGLDQSGSKTGSKKLTGMDWRSNDDGTETAYGQKPDGTWAPHRLEDGSPYSREEKPEDAPRVSNATLTDLEREFKDDIDGTDWNMVRTVEAEIERLMVEEDMAEPEAKRAALGAMRWKERREGSSGILGFGAREPSEEINTDRRGEFFDFVYDDAPGADDTATPPRRTPPPDPQLPPDPGARDAGSVAPDRALSGDDNLPAPTSRAEVDKLPKGTRYRDPEGKVRIKS